MTRLAYFAYGSNLNRRDMLVRCPDASPGTSARLDGWRLTFRGVADIEPAEGRVVHGALWRLTAECVSSLDRYEGAPSLYRQRLIEVETDAGPLEAMTYVMTSGGYLGLPSEWYFGRIKAGYRDWSLSVVELHRVLEENRQELAGRGVRNYRPDGRKRLKAVI